MDQLVSSSISSKTQVFQFPCPAILSDGCGLRSAPIQTGQCPKEEESMFLSVPPETSQQTSLRWPKLCHLHQFLAREVELP